jgi:hypothetical protein
MSKFAFPPLARCLIKDFFSFFVYIYIRGEQNKNKQNFYEKKKKKEKCARACPVLHGEHLPPPRHRASRNSACIKNLCSLSFACEERRKNEKLSSFESRELG